MPLDYNSENKLFYHAFCFDDEIQTLGYIFLETGTSGRRHYGVCVLGKELELKSVFAEEAIARRFRPYYCFLSKEPSRNILDFIVFHEPTQANNKRFSYTFRI